jgi:hypothetical protein
MQCHGRGVLNSHLKISAVVVALALLIPASAIAKRPDGKPVRGHKHGQVNKQKKDQSLKLSTANVKGVVASNDGTTMTVVVSRASGHARACKEATLSFDLSDARFHTADNNASGDMDAGDFEVEHVVKVRAKVARTKGRKTVCNLSEATIMAKAVHNRTTPQVEEDLAETDEEEGLEDGDELGDDEEVVDDEEGLDDEEVLDDEELLDDETDV